MQITEYTNGFYVKADDSEDKAAILQSLKSSDYRDMMDRESTMELLRDLSNTIESTIKANEIETKPIEPGLNKLREMELDSGIPADTIKAVLRFLGDNLADYVETTFDKDGLVREIDREIDNKGREYNIPGYY